jgi:hypothetical protein
MGPRAAVAEPLLRAELADPTRATYDGSSEAFPDDERFLVAVATALAAVAVARYAPPASPLRQYLERHPSGRSIR